VISASKQFVRTFIARNPLSKVGLAGAQDGICESLMPLCSDKEALAECIDKIKAGEANFSLQKCLETVKLLFEEDTRYSQK
jgi:hypothetical protein